MINRFIFTLISTSWVWVVYGIQNKWILPYNSIISTAIVMILIPMLLTLLWLLVAEKFFSPENISGGCEDIEEAQNDFLSDYLGYFFIGIGIDDYKVLIMVYLIIFIFTFLSQRKLFNPLLLLMGYKYYNITTTNGIMMFLISRKELRSSDEVEFDSLRRINDMSYIDVGR
ncbi:MAG: hypothetical protein V8T22_05585 [Oscillospiraceae bacterium]